MFAGTIFHKHKSQFEEDASTLVVFLLLCLYFQLTTSWMRNRTLNGLMAGSWWAERLGTRLEIKLLRPKLRLKCVFILHSGSYSGEETFEGENFCELVKNTIFTAKTFTDCSLVPCQRIQRPQNSWRKLLRLATNLQNLPKFSPLKVFCCMVQGTSLCGTVTCGFLLSTDYWDSPGVFCGHLQTQGK